MTMTVEARALSFDDTFWYQIVLAHGQAVTEPILGASAAPHRIRQELVSWRSPAAPLRVMAFSGPLEQAVVKFLAVDVRASVMEVG
jgi:hypothetical protein